VSISQHINLDQILQELENIMNIILQQGVDPAGTISIKKNKNKNYKLGMKSSKDEEIKVACFIWILQPKPPKPKLKVNNIFGCCSLQDK
jgi:hypothetical protein